MFLSSSRLLSDNNRKSRKKDENRNFSSIKIVVKHQKKVFSFLVFYLMKLLVLLFNHTFRSFVFVFCVVFSAQREALYCEYLDNI